MQHNRELVKRICQRVPTSRIINLVFFWKLGSFGTILLLTSSQRKRRENYIGKRITKKIERKGNYAVVLFLFLDNNSYFLS